MQKPTAMADRFPSKIERHSDTTCLLEWSTGERFSVPYFELRFECPCASCVNEITGQKVLKREHVKADVRPVGVQLIGRYAIKYDWSDGHSTGMYAFESLFQICEKSGLRLEAPVADHSPICG